MVGAGGMRESIAKHASGARLGPGSGARSECYTREVYDFRRSGVSLLIQSAAAPLAPTVWGRHRLDWGRRTYVMGILNVTPDSFSRDGLAPEGADRERVVAAAVEQAQRMVADGADML